MPVEVSCLACSTKFKVKPSRLKKGYGKYCSRKCANVSAIPAMNKARHKFLLSKEKLDFLYTHKKLTIKKIAQRYNVSVYPVRYWLKKYNIYIRTNSEAHLGQKSWNKGKPQTKEVKMKISQANYKQISVICQYCNKHFSVIPCRLQKGEGKYCSQRCYGLAQRKKRIQIICKYCKKEFLVLPSRKDAKYCSKQCYGKDNFINRLFQIKSPTRPEKRLIEIIKRYDLPIKYVGDGKTFIGRRVPDFIVSLKLKVIEVFGLYWHSPLFNPHISSDATYEETLKHYATYGYSCLIIWETELPNEQVVLNKINNFLES